MGLVRRSSSDAEVSFGGRCVWRGRPRWLHCYPRRSRKPRMGYVVGCSGTKGEGLLAAASCGWKHPTRASGCCALGVNVSAFHPARRSAAGSRSCVGAVVGAHAVGGGRLNPSGTMESGARNIVANSAGRSRFRWRAVRTTLARTCWVSAPLRVRLPPHTLRMTTAGRMACSARQLVASTDGSHRNVKMAPNSLARSARAPHVRSWL